MKFLLKEDFVPGHVNTIYFWMAPCLDAGEQKSIALGFVRKFVN